MKSPAFQQGSVLRRSAFVLAAVFALGAGAWYATGRIVQPPVSNSPISLAADTPIHAALPEEVRGFYMTARMAGSSRLANLRAFAKRTGLNTVVIDLKTDEGTLAFAPNDSVLAPQAPKHPLVGDLEALLQTLHRDGLYCIARIAVMRDSVFARLHPDAALRVRGGALWYDTLGLNWIDPTSKDVATSALALAREAYARGFDEIQFDYVRFPSDGKISSVVYPQFDRKTQTPLSVMKAFFSDVGGTLKKEKIPVSFDLFGMTYWRTDDFGVGQHLADVYPNADALSPMVYPSHFPATFRGYTNPAAHPYDIVKSSLDTGAGILKKELGVEEIVARQKARPWIQDFDLGAPYGAKEVEAQIQAARDGGASGWLIWNARNVYDDGNYGPKN